MGRSTGESISEANGDPRTDESRLYEKLDEVLAIARRLGIDPDRRHRLPAVLTVREVAKLLRLNHNTVYQGLQSGDIPGVMRVGRCVRVARDPLIAWMHDSRRRRRR